MTIRSAFVAAALIVAVRSVGAQCSPAIRQLSTEGKFDDARAQAQAMVAANPNDDQAVHCLGVILMDMKRPREAVPQFERAIKLNEKSSAHHLWLGDALGSLADSTSKLKQPFLARRIKAEFERAVELDPRNIGARSGLIQFYARAPGFMGGSMDKAKEQAREIVKINPPRGHLEMGNLLYNDKKIAEAEAEYVEAVNNADSSFVWYQVGQHYVNQKMWTEAFALYDRMLKAFPSEQMVHFYIGRIAAFSGQQLGRGEAELKVWIAAPPKNIPIATLAGSHHRLGMIYEQQGKKDLARAEYNKALEIDPTSENAKKSLAALKP